MFEPVDGAAPSKDINISRIHNPAMAVEDFAFLDGCGLIGQGAVPHFALFSCFTDARSSGRISLGS